jgi:hypothetical protein
MTVDDRDSAKQRLESSAVARKPWATPRIILEDARSAGGGTSVTTIDFVNPPITSFAS